MSRHPRLGISNREAGMTRLTRVARMARGPILSTLTSLTRLPRVVRLNGRTFPDRLTNYTDQSD